jgi:hypothetical protein
MLSAIITISCDDDTIAGIRHFLAECTSYGVDPNTELLDGGWATVEDGSGLSVGRTIRSLTEFAEKYGDAAPDTTVLHGTDICVDLVVLRTTPISCGSHIGELPTNVLVEVHPSCTTCA